MTNDQFGILVNPCAAPLRITDRTRAESGRSRGARLSIGVINNGKPNVAAFLDGVTQSLASQNAGYELLSVVKPRSAAACPELAKLSSSCDLVINAVAD